MVNKQKEYVQGCEKYISHVLCRVITLVSHVLYFSGCNVAHTSLLMYLASWVAICNGQTQNNTTNSTESVTMATKQPMAVHQRSFLQDNNLTEIAQAARTNIAASQSCPTDKCTCTFTTHERKPYLDCTFNQLEEIPLFQKVDTIFEAIDFKGNSIRTIRNNAFVNLSVNRIDLLENRLDLGIEPQAFSGLKLFLGELKIEGNGIIPLPFDKMTNLTNLRLLTVKNFRQNNPSEIAYFQHFDNLQTLQMIDINMLSLDSNTFQNKLQHLEFLNLQNVYISSIPSSSLQHLTRLQTLYIKQNDRLTNIANRAFEPLFNLKNLSIVHNVKLADLDVSAFAGVSKTLVKLNLGSNNLKKDALNALKSQEWTSLEDLTLSYNYRLTHFEDRVFENMGRLNYLYMAGLNLKIISAYFLYGLKFLYSLDLSYNEIESFATGAFKNTPELMELKLGYQFDANSDISKKMSLSPEVFKDLGRTLQSLSFEYTPVHQEQVWSTLEILPELLELNLRKTYVSVIPNYAFRKNTKLMTIDLQENSITDLSNAAFAGLEDKLIEVFLETNHLTTISECVFQNFTKLRKIRMRQNPLTCDCRLVWLHKFIHQGEMDRAVLREEFVCSAPAKFENMPLFDITMEALCSHIVAEDCSVATTKITTPSTSKTSKAPPSYNLRFTIPSRTQSSITLSWSVDDKSEITGFKLIYYRTVNSQAKREHVMHRDEISYVINNLESATFYIVCIMAEVNNVFDTSHQKCQTIQTFGTGETSGKHEGNTDGSDRYIIIAVVIVAVVVVILISVGVCAVVKYKLRVQQQMQQIPFTLQMTGRGQPGPAECQDETMVCTIPNEYFELNNSQMMGKYMHSPHMIHRQFGVDRDENPYHPYHRIKIRRNPYENDDEGTEDEDGDLNASKEILFKPTPLEERHSAPSRLDANDLLKEDNERNSRPLPVPPTDKQQSGPKSQARANTLQVKRKRKAGTTKTPDTSTENLADSEDDDDKLVLKKNQIYNKAEKSNT